LILRNQLQTLLQTKCGLAISKDDDSNAPEVHIDILMVPVEEPDTKKVVVVALVRTTVWRHAKLSDTAIQPDKPVRLAGWLLTTLRYLKDDPSLTKTVSDHVDALAASLHPTGLPILPRGLPEAIFESRRTQWKQKIEQIINQRYEALPIVGAGNSKVTVELSLQDRALQYTFGGTVKGAVVTPPVPPLTTSTSVPFTQTVNSSGSLDLLLQIAMNTLSTAKITLKAAPPLPDQSVTVAEISQ
jgi:hypothetical protein